MNQRTPNSTYYQTPAGLGTFYRHGSQMVIVVPDSGLPIRLLMPKGYSIDNNHPDLIERRAIYPRLEMISVPVQEWAKTAYCDSTPL